MSRFLALRCVDQMTNSFRFPGSELTPEIRHVRVAAILAQGVQRRRRATRSAKFEKSSLLRETSLELVSETRLSVSWDLADSRRDTDREVNDERSA